MKARKRQVTEIRHVADWDEPLLVMPNEPQASYPRKNALSDIFDCMKGYINDIGDGSEETETLQFVINQPTHVFGELRFYQTGQARGAETTLHSTRRVVESDHTLRHQIVSSIGETIRVNGMPGQLIYDDLKQLTDMYHRVRIMDNEDWTQGIWLSVEWLLNEIAGYYKPFPSPLPNRHTDNGYYTNAS
jgi:hypothetical protein